MARAAAARLPADVSPLALPVVLPLRSFLVGFDWSGRSGRWSLAAVALAAGGARALLRLGPDGLDAWSPAWEAVARIGLALLVVPAAGHVVRRLHDAGLRGAWAWLLLVPWVRWGLVAALLTMPPSQRPRPLAMGWRVIGQGVAGIAALAVVAGLWWSTAPVLADGMAPALRPGDLALLRRAPVVVERGDVVAFRLDGSGGGPLRFARVIGLPGERVALVAGVPVIDGVPATHRQDGWFSEPFAPQGPAGVLPLCGNGAVGLGADCTTRRIVETLPRSAGFAVLDAGFRARADMAPVRVPAGRLFVLGDHRGAAADSRLPLLVGGTGLVPLSMVAGRVDRVLASTAASLWDPRRWRLDRLLAPVR